VYPALNSFGTVAGFDVVGKITRCTEYRMYKKRAVLMGVPRLNEKAISYVLGAVRNRLASWKVYQLTKVKVKRQDVDLPWLAVRI